MSTLACPVNVSPELAAAIVLANTLAAKMYMSFAFRTKLMCVTQTPLGTSAYSHVQFRMSCWLCFSFPPASVRYAERSACVNRAAPDAEKKKILEGDTYQIASKSQLNEAEYAPILFAQFLFLSVKGIQSPWCCFLGAVGGPIFMWGRTLIGLMPFTPMGAMPRYISMGIMAATLFNLAQ